MVGHAHEPHERLTLPPDGVEPWGLSKKGKEELEETAARKAREKAPPKGETTLFMGELEQGLDENAE